ncbi:KdsC family phosphatase [Ferruginibacter albus]|uniref:KdsC family phosphatase n=1 Tax=Ferruginibacter albus TaxID=2875540 RepID=UPI001CC341CC|nr:HAD hydrolase family protein [Ferruginibacter albus]UAY50764.1 HAD hydrolase family protein [Ferruginibacter albus]
MNVLENFKAIKALVFDVDGVLASDTLLILEGGQITRNMNSKDGYALQLAVKKGYHVAIVSGGDSDAVKIRLERLGITDIFLQVKNKKQKLEEYVSSKNLKWEQVLYMGDDIPDYYCLQSAGLPCCPANAAIEIKEIAKYISPFNGGEGCARDVIEKVLKLNGHWGIDTSVQNK